jgi:hypothetical protein
MNSSDCKSQEDFENSLFYFIDAVKVLSQDAENQCREMGNFNVPWEIRHDVVEGGSVLLHSTASYLIPMHNEKLSELISSLNALPEEAIAPTHLSMTSHIGCLIGMNHPAWIPLRQEAKQLLQIFDPAIQKNAIYFREQ